MRQFWDSQLKFSQIIAGFPNLLEQMVRDSETFAGGCHLMRQAYGTDPRQWVETTRGTGPADVLPVIVHGGYWRALRAEDHRFMMAALLPHGATVANVEYRLMPERRLGDLVSDVQSGLRALIAANPGARLLLIGHSAGAHLSLSAVTDPGLAAQTLGIIALSGVYDLAPVAQSFLQAELSLSPSEIAGFTLRPSATRPPVLYVNGGAETHELLRGGALMASTGAADWHVIEDANHLTLVWDACAQMQVLVDKLNTVQNRS